MATLIVESGRSIYFFPLGVGDFSDTHAVLLSVLVHVFLDFLNNCKLYIFSVMGYREKLVNYPKPRFLPTESNYTYTRGDTATLHCNVANLGTKTVNNVHGINYYFFKFSIFLNLLLLVNIFVYRWSIHVKST